MASPISPSSFQSPPQSPRSTNNRCETLSSASLTVPTSFSSTRSIVLPACTKVRYTSTWDTIRQRVSLRNKSEAEEKANGDLESQDAILAELTAKFDRVCDAAFETLNLQPYIEFMNDHLKMAFYEVYVWENMCIADEFPGDVTALEDFKNWYFTTPEAVMKGKKVDYYETDGENSDGGVFVASSDFSDPIGFRVGDGETEDRYADGETESTDGGAKLRWY